MTGALAATLRGSRILLAIGGGIAAYKSLELIRALRREGAEVTVALTPAAQRFITALSAESLSNRKVHTDLFQLGAESEMGHIELSRSADLVVVAPATADLLAKMAHGSADDLVSTLLLATDKRVLAAPAMNVRMWLHAATRANVDMLRARGVAFVGPDDGDMACGEFGPGRMAEPAAIATAIATALAENAAAQGSAGESAPASGAASAGSLRGRTVVVTSGPTYEPIDPVRFIANRSSGRQGHAIAAAAAAAGARVTLVSGPVALPDPPGVAMRRVETAAQMLEAVAALLPADVFVGVAAVADWRPSRPAGSKLKKNAAGAPPALALTENPDILAQVAQAGPRRPTIVVGFAAETEDLLAHARDKLARKGCDLIVANDVGVDDAASGGGVMGSGSVMGVGSVMGSDENTVHLVSAAGVEAWPRAAKSEVARRLVQRIAEMIQHKEAR